MIHILGAGMAGCLAGILNNKSMIIEARGYGDIGEHKAVLRFRTDRIGRITGIPFKKVQVRKAIWYEQHEYARPEIRFINMYSKKVSGSFTTRSIVNLDTVERFIPPLDFHEILVGMCLDRIEWCSPILHINNEQIVVSTEGDRTTSISRDGVPIISTLPMSLIGTLCNLPCPVPLKSKVIQVIRFQVPGSDLHQTLYYPAPESEIPVYRASIIEDILTVETLQTSFDPTRLLNDVPVREVLNSFGLHPGDVQYLDQGKQLGKIQPIDDKFRKRYIFDLTMQYQLYSLGRFAIWKNILMDDVYDDILTIRQFIESGSHYDNFKSVATVQNA
jgi:hypothetical protein